MLQSRVKGFKDMAPLEKSWTAEFRLETSSFEYKRHGEIDKSSFNGKEHNEIENPPESLTVLICRCSPRMRV